MSTKTVELTSEELSSVLMALLARETDRRELRKRFAHSELHDALDQDLAAIQSAIKKLETAHSELL